MIDLYPSADGLTKFSNPLDVATWLRDKADDGVAYRIIFEELLPVDFSAGAMETTAPIVFDTAKRDNNAGLNVKGLAPTNYSILNNYYFETELGFKLKTSLSSAYLDARPNSPQIFEFAAPFVLRGSFNGNLFADEDFDKTDVQSTGKGAILSRMKPGVSFSNSGFVDFEIRNFWRALYATNDDNAYRSFLFFERGLFSNIGKSPIVINMPAAKMAGNQNEHISFRHLKLVNTGKDVSATVGLGTSSCRNVSYENIQLSGRHTVTISFEETDDVRVDGIYGQVRHDFYKRSNGVLHVKANNMSTGGGANVPNRNLNISRVFVEQVATLVPGGISNGLILGSGNTNETWASGAMRYWKFDGFNKDVADNQLAGTPKNYVLQGEGV